MKPQSTDTTAATGDISRTELLPFLLSFRDLQRRAFFWPGVFTALFGISLLFLAGADSKDGFFWCLASYISLANIFMIYLWSGKKMPFPYILGVTVFAFVLDIFLIPTIVAAEKALPAAIAPGLVEETVKALPLLLILVAGRALSHARQRKYGLREPLDGIVLAAASATGFAFLETMFIYVPRYGTLISTPRLLVNIFGHIAYAAAFGYFIGLAALRHRRVAKIALAILVGFVLANVLHDLWDGIRFYGKGFAILSPLHEVVVAVLSFVVLTSMILKAREVSPVREFLWPFGSLPPYLAPEVAPLPAMPALPGDFWLAIGNNHIRLAAGSDLTRRDIPCLEARTQDGVIAEVRPHPRDPAVLVLRNLSTSPWEAVLPEGTVRAVEPAATVRLAAGTRLDFGSLAGAVVVTDPAADPPPAPRVEWC